ncbi:MAG: DUF1475 family protein [Vampirovibrionales bacterium]|nr:DUF1475 family protein [Vampirovibrionales bacterium]
MRGFLIALFSLILLVMLTGVISACLQQNMFLIPPQVSGNPWFRATLLDAYAGFLIVFVWIAFRERLLWVKLLWFVLLMSLGNIATSTYVLWALIRLPKHAPLSALFLPVIRDKIS